MRTTVRLLTLAALLLASIGPGPAGATFPGRNGSIAFTSDRAENLAPYPQVYTIQLDGRRRTRLSAGLRGAQDPQWSPDGKTIAFVRYGFWAVTRASPNGSGARVLAEPGYFPMWSPDGTRLAYGSSVLDGGLRLVNADGSSDSELVPNTQQDAAAAWSPDGTTVAFLRYEVGARYGIYAVNVADRSERKLAEAASTDVCVPSCGYRVYPRPSWAPDSRRLVYTDHAAGRYRVVVLDTLTRDSKAIRSGSGNAVFPAWSPNGRTIALSVGAKNRLRIVLIDPKGRPRKLAAPARTSDLYPTWSADGRLLAFVRRQERDDPSQQPSVVLHGDQLYVLDTRTMKTRRVTSELPFAELGPPTWSPDGRALAYASVLNKNDQELFIRYPDGSERALTDNLAEESGPAWSADGRRLAFASDRDGDFEIYVTDPDGQVVRQLTHNRAVDDIAPDWSPDGTQLAFTRRRRAPRAVPQLWVMRQDGSGQRRFAREKLGILESAWSPDGTALAYSYVIHITAAVRIVELGRGRSCLVGLGSGPAWSPDSRLVRAYAYKSAAVSLYGPDCAQVGGGDRFVWAPDGTRVTEAQPHRLDWQPRCTIEGTSRNDVLTGTPGDDVICAFAGTDIVLAGGGHDVVYGGPGNDRLDGGDGEDWLFGADGDDVLRAADGAADVVNGGPGQDRAEIDAGDRAMAIEVS